MAKPTLHIIDDDEEICSEISDALCGFGFECSWATSAERLTGPGGLDADVLLLDLSLPDLDGFQVIRRLANQGRRPNLVVASGQEQRIIQTAVRQARDIGLNVLGSLEKPYSIRSLLALLENEAVARPREAAHLAPSVVDLLRDGNPANHVQTAFQSKRRLSDGAIVGYEALLRVTADGIPVSPEAIFDTSVNLETQLQLTQTVLDAALDFGTKMLRAGTPTKVSVNCTPAILCTPDLPEMVMEALCRWEMPATHLVIEITEHAAVHSFDAVATAACRLAMRNCGISIDDFGRGTTSLERLFDLPLTELKVDKEIFWKCSDGREPPHLLREIVRYCDEREITSTIEGIETPAHLHHAVALGAQTGQGYFWDRPTLNMLSPSI